METVCLPARVEAQLKLGLVDLSRPLILEFKTHNFAGCLDDKVLSTIVWDEYYFYLKIEFKQTGNGK